MALGGRGWNHILNRLSSATGRSVRLIGVHGSCVATAPAIEVAGGVDPIVVARAIHDEDPMPVMCSDGWRGVAVVLSAGRRRVGMLAVEGERSESVDHALDAARVPMCIEAVRRDAEAAARSESASWLIDELRFGPLRDSAEPIRVAARYGLRLDLPHLAVVFDYSGTNVHAWRTALSWIEFPVRVDGREGWTILSDGDHELHRIRTRLQGMVGTDMDVLVASGSVVDDVTEVSRSFREAEAALAVVRRNRQRSPLRFRELGLLGLMMSVPRERLDEFVRLHLGPILERPELLETLEAWIELDGRRSAVAERLFIHRNSVGYRIGRIRELLGADPGTMSASLQLHAALVAKHALIILDDLQQQPRGAPIHPRTE